MNRNTDSRSLSIGGGRYESPATSVVELEIEGTLCNNASLQENAHEVWDEEDLW